MSLYPGLDQLLKVRPQATCDDVPDEAESRISSLEMRLDAAREATQGLLEELDLLTTPKSVSKGEVPQYGYFVLAWVDNVWQAKPYFDDGAFEWWLPMPDQPKALTEVERLRAENAQLRKRLEKC